jgi:hypothetical protein
MDWREYLGTIRPRRSTAARDELAERYADVTTERLALARAVGAELRKDPLYAVVPYKESFSPDLVRTVLDHTGVSEGSVLDPFAGAGTSLLVAAERGMRAVGVDLLPFAAFAADTLLHAPLANWAAVDRRLAKVLDHTRTDTGVFPDFPVRDWAFTHAALAELMGLHDAIRGLRASRERNVLQLALLCAVEAMSQATKDGTSLRKRPHGDGRRGRYGARRTRAHVRGRFEANVELLRQGAAAQAAPVDGSAVACGDARDLLTLLGDDAAFDIAVFSPPYPNRYDYVANYQLELGFGFVRNGRDLRKLRKQQLRSHMEAPWTEQRTVELPALEEFFAGYLDSHAPNGRVVRMVSGYFEDMMEVLCGVRKVMCPGGVVAIVIGTQVFAGEPLPTDLLLAQLAEAEGYTVEEIWLVRNKGIAVQQRKLGFGAVASRETVLFLTA